MRRSFRNPIASIGALLTPNKVRGYPRRVATLTLIALAAGVSVGLIARGQLRALHDVKIRGTWLIYLSVLVGIAMPLLLSPPKGLGRALVLASYLGILAVLLLNLRERTRIAPGLVVFTLGWVLNFAPIAANGAMPLSLWAHREAGRTDVPTPGRSDFFKVVVAGPGTSLRQLGDAIPIRPLGLVVSAGDLVMMIGVATTIALGMRRPSEISI